MEFIYITNNPEIAKYVQDASVDRIMIDLEYIGKRERQGLLDTVISNHSLQDIDKVKRHLSRSKLQVRVNPIHKDSEREINEVICRDADIVMLPMFKSAGEVEVFINLVGGRAKTSLLLETAPAMVRAEEICRVKGIDEIHIGLNDLYLSMWLDFMFEILSGGIVEYLGNIFKKYNIKWGFGGIAKIGQGDLPAEYILAEHVRLNSQIVILSRTFYGRSQTVQGLREINFIAEVQKLREKEKEIRSWSEEKFIENNLDVREKVEKIVEKIQQAKDGK